MGPSSIGLGHVAASRRRLVAVLLVLAVLAAAVGLAYWSRGAWVCRDVPDAGCFACCRERGFRISGSGGGATCECFDAVELVDHRGTTRLGSRPQP